MDVDRSGSIGKDAKGLSWGLEIVAIKHLWCVRAVHKNIIKYWYHQTICKPSINCVGQSIQRDHEIFGVIIYMIYTRLWWVLPDHPTSVAQEKSHFWRENTWNFWSAGTRGPLPCLAISTKEITNDELKAAKEKRTNRGGLMHKITRFDEGVDLHLQVYFISDVFGNRTTFHFWMI